jgi:hypothetical protein
MGRYMINDGSDGFTVCDDCDAVVASGVSLVAAIELVHQGRRFCEAGQKHTNDAVRSDRHDPGASTSVRARRCTPDRSAPGAGERRPRCGPGPKRT